LEAGRLLTAGGILPGKLRRKAGANSA